MVDNPLIEIKKSSFWWWIAVITAVLGAVIITGSGARKLILADVEAGSVKCVKVGNLYEIEYTDNGTTVTKYYTEGQRQEVVDFVNRNRTKLGKESGCDELAASEVDTEAPQTFTLDIKKPFRNDQAVIGNWKLAHDPNPHEAAHGINALSRQLSWDPKRTGTGLHIGFNKNNDPLFIWLYEPKGSIRGLARAPQCVPMFFKELSRYETYVTNASRNGWDNITYLFDEWSAYTIGGRARLEMLKQGKKQDPSGISLSLSSITEGPADFMIIGGSAAVYLKRVDPRYFKSDQFRSVLKLLYESSIGIIRDAEKVGNLKNAGHTLSVLNNLRTSPDAAVVRAVLTEMYGPEWTKNVLGF